MSILPGMRDFNNGHAAHKPYTLKDRGGYKWARNARVLARLCVCARVCVCACVCVCVCSMHAHFFDAEWIFSTHTTKSINKCNPVFDSSRHTIRCSLLEDQTATSLWITFVLNELSFICSFVSFILRIVPQFFAEQIDFITLWSKQKLGRKPSPNDDGHTLQLSEANIRCVKWSSKSLVERHDLKN